MNDYTRRINAVRDVQKMLGLPITGFFTSDDVTIIKQLQNEHGLPETGTVDSATYEEIRRLYQLRTMKDELEQWYGFYQGESINYGESGNYIEILNAYLSEVLFDFGYRGRYPRGSFYSKVTRDAVLYLNEAFGIKGEGEKIDYPLLYEIRREIIASRRRENSKN